MSLLSSLYTASTGLEANSTDLSVIGNNISNADTVGFKASRADFEDALSQSMIGPSYNQIGTGTSLESIQRLMTQGALTNTGVSTDMAIQGNGMFVVKGNYNGVDTNYYTRAGQFTTDNNGYLVNPEGLRVQGYAADQTGAVSGTLGDLDVGAAADTALQTSNVTVKANLNSDAPVIAAAWDPTNPSATSNFSTSVTVHDSLGKTDQVDVYYRRTGSGTWDFHAMTDGSNVQGGTAGTGSEIATGTLAFDTNGKLTTQTQTSNFNPVNATQPQALTFNFGTPTGTGGTGLDGVTQFASDSAFTFAGDDGHAAGSLASLQVDTQGDVTGTFTNGDQRILGQVAIATFPAEDKLQDVGGNLYTASIESGQVTVGGASSGGRGSIAAGELEASNVDMSNEFVKMIAAQRDFQANGKTITAADQLLQELMQIKR